MSKIVAMRTNFFRVTNADALREIVAGTVFGGNPAVLFEGHDGTYAIDSNYGVKQVSASADEYNCFCDLRRLQDILPDGEVVAFTGYVYDDAIQQYVTTEKCMMTHTGVKYTDLLTQQTITTNFRRC